MVQSRFQPGSECQDARTCSWGKRMCGSLAGTNDVCLLQPCRDLGIYLSARCMSLICDKHYLQLSLDSLGQQLKVLLTL